MKVIFQDVDGCLNTQRFRQLQIRGGVELFEYNNNFDPLAMRNLADLVRRTGAYIVLTSARRVDQHLVNRFKEQLVEYEIIGKYLGTTPIIGHWRFDVPRSREIKAWLKENIDVESFVIIDDNDDMEDLINKLAQCYPYDGVTEEVVSKAVKILNQLI